MKPNSTIPEGGVTYKGKKVIAERVDIIKPNGEVFISRALKGQKATVLVLEE